MRSRRADRPLRRPRSAPRERALRYAVRALTMATSRSGEGRRPARETEIARRDKTSATRSRQTVAGA